MRLRYCFLVVPLFLSGSLLAELSVKGVTAVEMSRVPEYCRYTQNFRSVWGLENTAENIAHWTSILGSTYHGLHHYCAAMIETMRAQDHKLTPQWRLHLLGQAADNIEYSIRDSPPDYVLLPEMYTKRGRVLVQMKKVTDAANSFSKAISLKPDYWPPYADLSDLYKANGDRTKAQSILEEGLKNIPGSKPLESRLKGLSNR